jgi:hypothetical protein
MVEPRTKRRLVPLCQGCPHEHEKELINRVQTLEEISAMPGEIPWRYYEQLKQLQGQITFIQNKLNAALDRGKQRQETGRKEQPKSTYKGLPIEL